MLTWIKNVGDANQCKNLRAITAPQKYLDVFFNWMQNAMVDAKLQGCIMQRPDIGCILHRSALVSFTGVGGVVGGAFIKNICFAKV